MREAGNILWARIEEAKKETMQMADATAAAAAGRGTTGGAGGAGGSRHRVLGLTRDSPLTILSETSSGGDYRHWESLLESHLESFPGMAGAGELLREIRQCDILVEREQLHDMIVKINSKAESEGFSGEQCPHTVWDYQELTSKLYK